MADPPVNFCHKKLPCWRAVEPLMAKAAQSMRALAERRPVTQLMAPEQLPRRERGVRRVDEHFWRASASRHADAATGIKRQRTRGSGKPRKRLRRARKR